MHVASAESTTVHTWSVDTHPTYLEVLYGGLRYRHVTPLLRDKLHWLRFKERVKYKLCITVYNGLNKRAPTYIGWCRSPVGQAQDASAQQQVTTW